MRTNLIIALILLSATTDSQEVRIVSHSWIAVIAGRIQQEHSYAVTVGHTIYLNCSEKRFREDTPWYRHEMVHIQQYRKYGTTQFLKRYLFYSITRGYKRNPFEMEACSIALKTK